MELVTRHWMFPFVNGANSFFARIVRHQKKTLDFAPMVHADADLQVLLQLERGPPARNL